MSKGSNQRPRQVSYEEYAQNWDNIFNTKKRVPTREELELVAIPPPDEWLADKGWNKEVPVNQAIQELSKILEDKTQHGTKDIVWDEDEYSDFDPTPCSG